MRISIIGIAIASILAIGGAYWLLGPDKDRHQFVRSTSRADAPKIIQTKWSRPFAARMVALAKHGKLLYRLPELRVYDADARLVFRAQGEDAVLAGPEIDALMHIQPKASPTQPKASPTLDQTLADLQTRDGRAAAKIVEEHGKITVVDYWAEWCAPCKVLEKSLLDWAAGKPAGSVQIVTAEADIAKAAQGSGLNLYDPEDVQENYGRAQSN